jgi:hypothetical protein
MDDFKFVTFFKWSFGPTVARNNISIEFDGNPIGLHAERFDQSRKVQNWGVERAFFPIDLESHA